MTTAYRCTACNTAPVGGLTPLLDPRYATGYCIGCRRTRTFVGSAFDDAPGKVRRDHPDTARAAATSIIPKTGTLRRRVYDAVRLTGADGATDAELQRDLEMAGNTERPRRLELCEAGLIIDSGRRRYEQGRPMIVWIAAP